MKKKTSILCATAMAAILSSCGGYTPKPSGYFRIELPEKTYDTYNEDKYPFTFQYANNVSNVQQKKERDNDKYGLNIIYPKMRCCIYCDYKPINGNFREITEDCRSFVYKHTSKADAITTQPYENEEKKVYGLLYRIEGNTASQIQFVLTDSTKNLFRGALYFNSTPNADSLAPVLGYVSEDIIKLIESFEWKNK